MDSGLETVWVRGRSGVGSCQDLALQGRGRMTRERKLPGDSERESLRQKPSFRTGVPREDSAWANCPKRAASALRPSTIQESEQS